jgi:hypothetical protein
MAVLLVTYDLKQPGRDYQPVYDYLKKFTYCKGLESVWLLDTTTSTSTVRDGLRSLTDSNDVVLVVRLTQDWASYNYYCADWLNNSSRNW